MIHEPGKSYFLKNKVIDLPECQIHKIPEETSSGMSLSACLVLASITATKHIGSSEDSLKSPCSVNFSSTNGQHVI